MNKYHQILHKVLANGKTQTNKKGDIRYLINEQLSLTPADLLDIFEDTELPGRNSVVNSSSLCRENGMWRNTAMPESTGGIIAVPSS